MQKQGRTKAARFGAQYIRCVWNYEDRQWYYSVVDCISVLVSTKILFVIGLILNVEYSVKVNINSLGKFTQNA